MTDTAFASAEVEAAFNKAPPDARDGLLALRQMIFDVAAATDGVGALEETLKWGQPAYLTSETKSGSTLRLAAPKTGGYALYAHCQTSIISDFQTLFPEGFDIEGNRAVRFKAGERPPAEPMRLLIKAALTYHLK